MQALAISYKGIEDITALEIKELIKKESKIKERCVIFDAESEELAKLSYLSQGSNRILILLDEFKIKSIEDLKRISKIDFSKWLKNKTFAARCQIINNEFSAQQIEKATGDEIDAKVNLKNPDITIFLYIYKDNCYVGIDFSGDISKRDYRIFTARNDIKGPIAYALVRLSDYNQKKSFLNLNAKAGTIAIEAALFGSGLSPNFFNKNKFPFLKFTKISLDKFDKPQKPVKVYASDSSGFLKLVEKNAKIAGVDIKLQKQEADCIVSYDKTALIKNLKKPREVQYGKETLKIATFKNL